MTDTSGADVRPAAAARSVERAATPAYHLRVDHEEAQVASSALRLLISDEAHEPEIRGFARGVLDALAREPDANGTLVVELSAPQMKITHTAVKLLRDDLGREQADEQRVLARILDKLPDEHAIRAIVLD